jgi:transcriptional regulator with PAS, ATPase and Fis domain
MNGVQEPNIDAKMINFYTYNWPGNVREVTKFD